MFEGGFVRGFYLRGAFLSLPDPSGSGRSTGQGSEGLGRSAGGYRRESGIRDGQTGDYAGGGLAADRTRQGAARRRCVEAEIAAAEENRRRLERGRVPRQGGRRNDQACRLA